MNFRGTVACLCVCAFSLTWATSASPASGAEDYALDSTAWNGLSDLSSIAASGGLTLDARHELAWSDIGPTDVLFILYPTARVDPVRLSAFLRDGGRALIGDDFGRADEALARLGVLRHARRVSPARVFDENPNLPVAVPLDDAHPLTQGVGELVTNHPSAFSVDPGVEAVFGYGPSEAVVVAGSFGNGRYVAVSDPSILINDMLAFDGNLAFAANLLGYLAPTRPGHIFVVTGDVILTGEPRPPADTGGSMSLNEALSAAVSFLDELNDYLAPESVLRTIALVGGLGVLFVAAVALPLRRTREPEASFARLPSEPALVERLVVDLDDDAADKNFVYPAAVLRENVEPELEARLGSQPQSERVVTLKALELIRRLPPRTAAFTLTAHVTKKMFFQAYDAAQAALAPRAT